MVDGRISIVRAAGRLEWEVIAGARFVVALETPARRASTAAFIRAAGDPDASLERLIAATPAAGEPGESFALVWWPGAAEGAGAPAEVTIVARGAAVVDVASPGGVRRFEPRDIRPWHLAEFGSVDRLRITSAGAALEPDEADGEALGAQGRASGVASLHWRARAAAASDPRGAGWAPPAASETGPIEDPVPRYRLGDGPAIDLRSRVVVGRRPAPPAVPGEPVELVRVEDPGRVVSGSHLELRAEGGRVVATDLHSTNGTTIESSSRSHRLRAGESVVVRPGTRLRLGGDTIIEILPPRIGRPDDLDRQAPA